MNANSGARVGSAVRLTVLSTLLSGVLQAGVVVALARLIGPADYGAYVLCIAVLSVSTNFVTGSIERSLVVAETVNYRGLMFAAGLIVLSTAALTMGATELLRHLGWFTVRADLLAGLLIGGLFASLSVAPRVFLRRNLDYRWIVGSELAGIVIGVAATALILASMGFGATALVAGAMVQNLVMFLVLLVGGAEGVSVALSGRTLKTTVRNTLSVSRLSALEVAHGQIPNFFISTLGPAALGLFNRSQTIVQLPVQLLTASMSRVMISGIAAVADNRERLIRASRLTVMTTGAIVAPVNFGIAGSHVQFTEVMLGKNWAGAAPLVPILAFTSWALMTAVILGVISEAARHFGRKATAQAITSLVLLVLLATGVKFGLLSAAAAIGAGALFLTVANVILTARVLDIKSRTIVQWLAPSLTAGLGCGSFTWIVALCLHNQPALPVLLLQVSGCGILTAIYYIFMQREALLAILGATLPSSLNNKFKQWLPMTRGAANSAE
jgi:teichuronic acid exporter